MAVRLRRPQCGHLTALGHVTATFDAAAGALPGQRRLSVKESLARRLVRVCPWRTGLVANRWQTLFHALLLWTALLHTTPAPGRLSSPQLLTQLLPLSPCVCTARVRLR